MKKSRLSAFILFFLLVVLFTFGAVSVNAEGITDVKVITDTQGEPDKEGTPDKEGEPDKEGTPDKEGEPDIEEKTAVKAIAETGGEILSEDIAIIREHTVLIAYFLGFILGFILPIWVLFLFFRWFYRSFISV